MVNSLLLLKGLLIGLSIAMPVGPIGLLCIKRALTRGMAAGLATGLGAATADGLYGAVAGFGLAAVSSLLVAQQAPLRLVGGLVLIWLGAASFRERPAAEATAEDRRRSLLADYTTTVLLTLTNPATIISFAAVFASVGLSETAASYGAAASFVAAVFLGSALWWIVLSAGVSLARRRLRPGMVRWINRGSGLVLIGFGVSAWASLLL
ncbi:MAG TPA: LysE family transporter [Alphaproteobacteria bacterium]|nr:LysE family transporter [Alphaproteobacteria bacterium]